MNRNHLLKAIVVSALIFPLTSGNLFAQDSLAKKEKALNLLSKFAEDICVKIPLVGSGSNKELSGEAKVELSNLLKRVASLELGVTGKLQASEYEGPLREALPEVLETSTDCRVRVLELFKDEIFEDISKLPSQERLPYVIVSDTGWITYGMDRSFVTGRECVERLNALQTGVTSTGRKILGGPKHLVKECTRMPSNVWCLWLHGGKLALKGATADLVCHISQSSCEAMHESHTQSSIGTSVAACELLSSNAAFQIANE